MGLSDCPCGGHIPLGPDAANRCDKCGRGPWGERDYDGTDAAAPAWWRGQEDGVAGAAMRWAEALSDPIPKAGVMHEPLESLYRRTEALRTALLAYRHAKPQCDCSPGSGCGMADARALADAALTPPKT